MGHRLRIYGEVIFVAAAMMMFSSAAWPQNDAAHIFQTVCAECHGADGSGHTPKGQAGNIPDMRSAEVQKRSDADLAEMIINGKRSSRGLNYSMPSNKGKLTDQQVKGLVAYIRGLAKK
ncbi:MAG TPA: cytochrome c [Candidatus Acidoferrales bacterium]|nr:cytochrome c [Candidatus Acidoferrales bacterium]